MIFRRRVEPAVDSRVVDRALTAAVKRLEEVNEMAAEAMDDILARLTDYTGDGDD